MQTISPPLQKQTLQADSSDLLIFSPLLYSLPLCSQSIKNLLNINNYLEFETVFSNCTKFIFKFKKIYIYALPHLY